MDDIDNRWYNKKTSHHNNTSQKQWKNNMMKHQYLQIRYSKCMTYALLIVHAYHCLPQTTIYSVWMIIGHLKMRNILRSYTHYGWLIVSEHWIALLFILGCHWLPLVTIYVVGDNLEAWAIFWGAEPLWMVDSLRTLKLHHSLLMVTIGSS